MTCTRCGRQGHEADECRSPVGAALTRQAKTWVGGNAVLIPEDLPERFPSVGWGEQEWKAAFDADPDLWHRILDGIAGATTDAIRRGELRP